MICHITFADGSQTFFPVHTISLAPNDVQFLLSEDGKLKGIDPKVPWVTIELILPSTGAILHTLRNPAHVQ